MTQGQPALNINIAGQQCLVRCDDKAFGDAIAERYSTFLTTSPTASAIEIDVQVRSARVSAGWEPRFITHPGVDPVPLPPDYDPGRDGPLQAYEATAIPGGLRVAAEHTLRGEFDLASRRGLIVQERNIYLFHTALRQFLAYLLPLEGRGCLLHASGVALDAQAAGFFGVSGSGKSTIARLAPGAVLTDESLALLRYGGQWIAHTTPFWGDYDPGPSSVESAPLAGLFHLVKAERDRVTRLTWQEAVRGLSQSLMYQVRDPAYEAALFRQACALASEVPCYRLEFRPTVEVWDSVSTALREH
ncbi:MAG TPA: hypothetical protein VEY08_14275 [Chloroflexia bacterium]|nr:hypothetical protein [Chloroflexia bacterium]